MTNLLSSWGNLIYMFLMISSYLRLSGFESESSSLLQTRAWLPAGEEHLLFMT